MNAAYYSEIIIYLEPHNRSQKEKKTTKQKQTLISVSNNPLRFEIS